MRRHIISRRDALAGSLASGLVLAGKRPGLAADSLEAFFRAQPLRIIVGTSVGATYDGYARLIARHIGRFLPGAPTVIVQNMAGAGGLTAANYLYNVAPCDGSTISIFARGLPMLPLLDPAGVRFETTKFNWLGSPASEVSVVWAWHTTPFNTFADIQHSQMIIPATGPGADSFTFPFILNGILGTKFKIIPGYPGSPELFMAVERGEAQGVASTSWNNFTSTKRDWVRDHKVRFLLQLGLKKLPAIGDVPLVLDMAQNATDRKALELVFSRNSLAYPIAAPPAVPQERVGALADALARLFDDPLFRQDAASQNLELDPIAAAEMNRIIDDLVHTSDETIARVKTGLTDGERTALGH